MTYRNRNYHRKPEVRTIAVKFAGKCHCCGGPIKAGEIAAYYPAGTIASQDKGVIAHVGGLEGNSSRCFANLKAERREQECTAAYVAEGLGEW